MNSSIIGGISQPAEVQGVLPIGRKFVAICDKGIGYPKPDNEDRIVVLPTTNSFAVIDGMGGMGGDKAAEILAEKIRSNPQRIDLAIDDANGVMPVGCGAAIIALTVRSGLADVWQAGDVRLIIQEHRSWLKRICRLHPNQQTEDETYGASRSIITNCVGAGDDFERLHHRFLLKPSDRLFVLSDGITDNIKAKEILKMTAGLTIFEAQQAIWGRATTCMQDRVQWKKTKTGPGEFNKCDNRSLLIIGEEE